MEIQEIQKMASHFAKERQWEKFHSPKNLAMSINIEAAELAEVFQWLTEEQSYQAAEQQELQDQVKDEVADVFIYLLRLCDVLKIDLLSATREKMARNCIRFDVEKSKAIAKKLGRS